jgi:hypothetical protein
MIASCFKLLHRTTLAAGLCAAMVLVAGASAQARVWVGIGVPFWGPGYYPAPYYYPPPAYYPPPPAVYAPPPPVVYSPPQTYSQAPQTYSQAPGSGGQACYAGSYVCPMDHPVASGASCYCAGNGGQRVWGRAN